MRNFQFAPQIEPSAVKEWLYACYVTHVYSLAVDYNPLSDIVNIAMWHDGYHATCSMTRDSFEGIDTGAIQIVLNEMKKEHAKRAEQFDNPKYNYPD